MKKIGVLALQGDFLEHESALKKFSLQKKVDFEIFEIRQKKDALKDFDALVLPGGESTVQSKLLHELEIFDILREKIEKGLPVFATCAGLILLASHFQTLPVTVKRNAFGRQLGSFYEEEDFDAIQKVPMTFIRAPIIETTNSNEVKVLAKAKNFIVAVKYKNQIAVSFHPELNNDYRVYEYFYELIENRDRP